VKITGLSRVKMFFASVNGNSAAAAQVVYGGLGQEINFSSGFVYTSAKVHILKIKKEIAVQSS